MDGDTALEKKSKHKNLIASKHAFSKHEKQWSDTK